MPSALWEGVASAPLLPALERVPFLGSRREWPSTRVQLVFGCLRMGVQLEQVLVGGRMWGQVGSSCAWKVPLGSTSLHRLLGAGSTLSPPP